MKGTCALVASVVAASTASLTSSTFCAYKGKTVSPLRATAGKEKYSPRFDGLRFIETLVTAHRWNADVGTITGSGKTEEDGMLMLEQLAMS